LSDYGDPLKVLEQRAYLAFSPSWLAVDLATAWQQGWPAAIRSGAIFKILILKG